jgi:transcriptional regulator with XRE-family HTH domain
VKAIDQWRAIRARLLAARHAAGMKQTVICRRTGLSQTSVSALETGASRAPRIETVLDYAREVGMGVVVLPARLAVALAAMEPADVEAMLAAHAPRRLVADPETP